MCYFNLYSHTYENNCYPHFIDEEIEIETQIK